MNIELIGKRIKDLRTDQDLSQQKLANRAGITTRVSISKYENGTSIPDLITLEKIARALNTTISYLIGESDYPKIQDEIFTYPQNLTRKQKQTIQEYIYFISKK